MFRKEQLDDQLDRELSFHFEQLVQENIEAGMSADAARLEAKRAVGNVAVFKEECRDQRRVSWVHDFVQDLRYGLRLMRKRAGLTAIAVVSLAVGIGANAAMLSVGSSLLLGDLPLPDAERLVTIQMLPSSGMMGNGLASIPDYVAWSEQTKAFESLGASISNQQDLGAERPGDYPERLSGQAVTPSLFRTLKVQPILGRVFREEEAELGRTPDRLIVLSHRLWQRRFGGAPDILGRQISLSGVNVTIVGVMPEGFWYPNEQAEYWVPLGATPDQLKGSARFFLVTARLRESTTLAQAQADVRTVAARLAGDFPERHGGWLVNAVPLRESWFGWFRQPLLMLGAAVVLVLLIACANVSTLLLGLVPARRPEVSMRLLMGAGRARLVRQFLTESLLLSTMGGALGLVVAWWGVSQLQALGAPPGRIPLSGVGETGSVLGFTALFAAASSLMFGLLPALAAFSSGSELEHVGAHRRSRSPLGLLVSAQVGIALILLVSSGLLMNSFVRLMLDDRGFDPRDVLTFHYRIPVFDYSIPAGSHRGLPAMDVRPPTLDWNASMKGFEHCPAPNRSRRLLRLRSTA